MYEVTVITWVLIIYGALTCIPLLFAQLVMLKSPHGPQAKELLIGSGEEWRDNSHFKSAYSLAVADWLIFFPIFVLAIIGMLMGKTWGFLLFAVAGAIQIYINIFLWFFEKEYVYPSNGPLKYYTYIWGNFVYWGAAALIYGIIRLSGIII